MPTHRTMGENSVLTSLSMETVTPGLAASGNAAMNQIRAGVLTSTSVRVPSSGQVMSGYHVLSNRSHNAFVQVCASSVWTTMAPPAFFAAIAGEQMRAMMANTMNSCFMLMLPP